MEDISCRNYFIFKLHFSMKNVGEEERKLQKWENLENEKSLLCEVESVFYIFKDFLLVKY